MSDTAVHNEILYWDFRNEDFEKKAAQTLTTLQKLEKALNINTLVDIAKGVKLDGLAKDVDHIADRFTNLGVVGKRVLENLTDTAMRTGKKFVESLTIDDAKMGWTKYEEQVGAVQTLMNTTGFTTKEIQSYVDKFALFSDETSYSLDQMVKAFSQMTTVADLSGTAAEKAEELQKIQDMIIGIANASAFAGKTGAEFQRTIYNLTQSYQSGALKLMDWKSLQMAGTASKQLMEELIKAAEDLYKETNGKEGIAAGEVTLQNFNEKLKTGWATTKVMQRAFGEFSEFANAALDAVAEGKYDNVTDAIADMKDQFDDLSVKAFLSAQQAKTFTEAINSVHDAVSTKWSETYRLIVGDYEEAAVLWTNVANALWDIFAAGGDERNKALEQWAGENGRYYLILSLQNILNSILSFTSPIKEAWESIFRPVNGHQLAAMTRQLFSFTKGLILTGDAQAKVRSIATDFASALKTLLDIFGAIVKPIRDFIGPIDVFGNKVLKILKIISLLTKSLMEMASQSEVAINVLRVLFGLFIFRKRITGTVKAVVGLTKVIVGLVSAIRLIGLVAAAAFGVKAFLDFRKWISTGKGAEGIAKITKGFQNLRKTLKGFDSWKLGDYVNAVKNLGSTLKENIFKGLGDIGERIKTIDWRSMFAPKIVTSVDGIISKIKGIERVIYNLHQAIQVGSLTMMDWKSIVMAGFGTAKLKPVYEGIVKLGVGVKNFTDLAKSGFKNASASVRGFFTKDIFTGISPFERLTSTLKNAFSSKEGFIHLIQLAKQRLVDFAQIAKASWKVPADRIDEVKDKLSGLPKLIFTATTGFKGFLTNLKNPEMIKSFGRTISDALSLIGSKALGGIDILTKGNLHDVLVGIADGFSKIKSVAGSFAVKGIDALYSALSKLHSLIGPSSNVISQGLGKLKDILQVLDVRLGSFAAKLIGTATSIKSRLPGLLQPIFKIFDVFSGGKYSKILDLGKSIINDLVGSLSKLGGGGFKNFTDSLKSLFNAFASGVPLTKTIGKLKDVISSFMGIFKGVDKSMSVPVRSMGGETNIVIKTLSDFKERLDYIVGGIAAIAHKINDVIPPELGRNIIKFVGLIAQVVIMKKVAKAIKEAFLMIGTGVKDGAASISNIFAPFKAVAENVPTIFSPFKALAEGLTTLSATIGTAITTFMDALRSKWKAEAFEYRANGIFKMASAVGVLAAAVWVVAQIPLEDGKLWKAAVTIGALMGALLLFASVFDKLGQSWLAEIPKLESVTSKLAGSIFYFGKSTMIASLAVSLIAMAGAVNMLMKPIEELSKMRWQDFAKGFIEVGLIIGGLAFAMGKLATSLKGSAPAILAGTLLLLLSTTILKSFLNVLSLYGEMFAGANWGKMLVGVLSVAAIVGGTTIAIVKIAQALSQFTTSAKYVGAKVNPAAKALLATGALLTSIVLFLMGMADVIKKFRKLKVRVRDIAVVMTAIGGVLLAIAGYASILKIAHIEGPVRTAAGLLVGFAGALALVALALNLFQNLDLEAIASALPVILGTIATMLGVMWALGQINGGMSIGSGLGILGFAAVITSLTVSLMLLTLIDYAKLESASDSLAKVILSVGVALGLASKFSGKATSIIAFSFVIKELVSALAILSFLDYAKLESAANNLTKVLLATGAMLLFSGGMATTGILQWIGVSALIITLVGSLLMLQDIDTAKLKNTATVVGALEAVSGIVMAITGFLPPGGWLNSLAALGGASLLVLALSHLVKVTGEIPDPEAASRLLNSASIFLGSIGVVIGILGNLTPMAGIKAGIALIAFLGVLGAAISILGSWSNATDQVSIRMMDNLEAGFTKIGEFIGDIAGGFVAGLAEKAGTSLDKISQFLNNVKGLKDLITADQATGIGRAIDIATKILSLEIPNDGGLAGLIFGNNNIGDFGDSIGSFGLGLKSFSDSISGITATDDEINGAIRAAEGLATLAQKIPESGGLLQALAGAKDLGEFAMQIAGGGFGGGISTMHGEFGGSGRSLTSAVTGAANAQRGLGGAIKLFTDSVKDIPDDAYASVDKALKAAQSIAEFAKHVPRTGGWAQTIAGAHDMAQFATSLGGDGTAENPGFVLSIKKLVRALTNMDDPAEAIAKLQATQPLLDMFKDNTGIFVDFKSVMAQNDLDSGKNSFVTRVEMMKGYMIALSELQSEAELVDAGKITNIANAITASASIMEFFDDNTGIFNSLDTSGGAMIDNILGGGESTLLRAIEATEEYAHKLAILSLYDYLDTGTISHVAQVLNSTSPILDFYIANTGPVKSLAECVKKFFDGGNNPLKDAIEALIPYAQALAIYSTKISGIGDMNKIIRSTVAFGNFADAVQTLFSSYYADQGGNFEYIGDFSGRLGTLADAMVELDSKLSGKSFTEATNGIKLITETLEGMKGIGPVSADGFVASVNKLAECGIDDFCEKFSKSEKEVNTAISDFITAAVGAFSRTTNQDRMKTGATNLYKGFIDGQKKSLDQAKQDLEKFFADLPSAIKINESAFINIGMKIPYSMVKGIQNGTPLLTKAVKDMQEAGLKASGDAMHDPWWESWKTDVSKDYKNQGLKIPFSSAKGVEEGTSFFTSAITNLYNTGLNTFQSFFGENGTFIGNARNSITGMFGNLQTTLTNGFKQLTGFDFGEIWNGSLFFSDGQEQGINLVENFFNKFTQKEEETAGKAKKIAENGASGVGKSVKGAGDKAVKEAEAAGKEILSNEDAFWVALLSKKKLGADASEYQDMKVKDFEKKMLDEVNKLVDDYKEKLNSTTDDILGMIGLFDKVEDKVEETEDTFGDLFKSLGDNTTKLEGNIEDLFRRVDTVTKSDKIAVSGDELMANLQDQIDKYTEYYDIQDELAKRINNNKLKKTLREMTIDSIEELKALNDMSDKELDEYVELFEKRIEVAGRGKVKKDAEESPTAEILTQNLEDQVEKYRDYRDVLANLNARVTSKKLKETLNGMGIDNMDELKVIESMTDEELSHYTALFEEKYSLSRDTAEIKLEETKQVTEDKLNELLETTGLQLDTFLEMFDGTLSSLTSLIENHLNGINLGGAMGHIAQELIKPLLEVFNNVSMDAETKVVGIRKAIESAAIAGVDITDQYTQGIIAILDNTEMTADEKLKGILDLMTQSQVSLAQSSKNLAQTTKDTIAKILSNAEASKLVKSLTDTLNSGVVTAEAKIEKFKEAIRVAGESNVQLAETYRISIEQLLTNTTLTAEQQVAQLLEILRQAGLDYQAWALQDINLLSQDLLALGQVSQTSLGGTAKKYHDLITTKLRETTDASEEEIETMAGSIETTLDKITAGAISAEEAFGSTMKTIVQTCGDSYKEIAEEASNSIMSSISAAQRAEAMAASIGSSSRSRDRNERSGSSGKSAFDRYEENSGKTLTGWMKDFAMSGGAIYGGANNVIKDNKYWDGANHMAYDLGSGVGEYTGAGFADGVARSEKSMQNAAVHAANSVTSAVENAFGIHSPSKVFMDIARFVVLGWVDGIDKYSNLIDTSAMDTTSSYIDIFNESMRNLDTSFDMNPVITPIVDMTRVEDSMRALDSLFNTDKSYSMASDIKRAADIAAKAKAEANAPVKQVESQQTTMNFTQNNYSPKALSKLDIYRQTKNQFAQMKGALA